VCRQYLFPGPGNLEFYEIRKCPGKILPVKNNISLAAGTTIKHMMEQMAE